MTEEALNGGADGAYEGDPSLDEHVRKLLELLPQDVVDDLNERRIALGDDGFLEAVMSHIGQNPTITAMADKRVLRSLKTVQQRLRALVREQDPEARVSETIRNTNVRVGRNDKCPCGSGRKYKQCCMRKRPN